ncbi:hypothetical protein ASG43_02725 [Aureimonas sp. Leaf454]|uniref:PCC domain-containing protein n=1 Tax=Aureimonas sp. Leaf454 TaxID=1736381 RepID=UPI0006F3C051|nr:DUF296 domain-containing protein [Aureimonas sp. Leaf454]KQT54525.1 hypothetical protein ASG43_02725 [Aureimonas sp. Leaf454]
MAGALRRLAHPGPEAVTRIEAVETDLVAVEGHLPAGTSVMEAVAAFFSERGLAGGVLRLSGGACDPYRYVLPALSTDGEHAAWYSATIAPAGGARLIEGTAIVGRRDGVPFLHCHGTWEADGTVRMGHMLPLDSVLTEPVAVSGHASRTALFDATPDAETAFTLFSPLGLTAAAPSRPVDRRGLFLRLRPHEDVAGAIAAACRRHGVGAAEIHGIGSINEVVFEDGRRVSCLATEIAIEHGVVASGPDGPVATLDVAVVDIDGAIHRGRLRPGDNPVGVTFELVLVEPFPEEPA